MFYMSVHVLYEAVYMLFGGVGTFFCLEHYEMIRN